MPGKPSSQRISCKDGFHCICIYCAHNGMDTVKITMMFRSDFSEIFLRLFLLKKLKIKHRGTSLYLQKRLPTCYTIKNYVLFYMYFVIFVRSLK
jgi:hypothetical protein